MKAKINDYSIADFITSGRKVKDQFFKQINSMIDWEKLRPIIENAYTKGSTGMGRPCHDSLVLFRIELLRTWYGLSDGEVEDQVNDRISFSRFAGISLDENCPDSTTISRFRTALVRGGAYDAILNEINRQLEKVGAVVKTGVIVDASITDTLRRPHGKKEYVVVEDRKEDDNKEAANEAFLKEMKKSNVDKEARWLKKAGKLHFGYKRHTVTDINGMILAEETTSASESDIKHLKTPLEKANLQAKTPVYADKGYASAENKETLKKMKLKDHIMHKATKNNPLSEREQNANVQISKIRYRVERTFGSIHCWFGGGVARYVGLAKTHGQHILEAVAHNLYRAPGIIMSNCAK